MFKKERQSSRRNDVPLLVLNDLEMPIVDGANEHSSQRKDTQLIGRKEVFLKVTLELKRNDS